MARATRVRLAEALSVGVLSRMEAAMAAVAAAGGDMEATVTTDDAQADEAAAAAAAALAALVATLPPAQRALLPDVEALVCMEAGLI